MTLAENLRTYWREHAVHVAVAAFAGWLLASVVWLPVLFPGLPDAAYIVGLAPVGFCIWAAQNIRQVCGFWSKRDTINHDLAVIQAGLVAGVVIGLTGGLV